MKRFITYLMAFAIYQILSSPIKEALGRGSLLSLLLTFGLYLTIDHIFLKKIRPQSTRDKKEAVDDIVIETN